MRFSKAVVKYRIPILIVMLLLMIPAVIGMVRTRVNYDMLDYLPETMDTVKGQQELLDEFGKGGFSLVIVEDMPDKDVAALVEKIKEVPHVDSALWYSSLADLTIPKEMLPDRIYEVFNTDHSTAVAVFFDSGTSADVTMEAVRQIRSIAGTQCFVSGLSALVTDLKDLCEKEEPVYVGLAVACALAAMLLLLDSWLVPFVFLASIGIMIVLNLGSNIFLGQISYITKALSAVLQLAVTMDYSIFLWHAYCARKKENPSREEAMALAIRDTVLSVAGSALTTIAGFLALCFMSYTMGADIGVVMAKGCLLGVLGSVTILPALILLLDKPLTATMHKSLIPDMSGVAAWITNHFWAFLVAFAVILVPATIGYFHTPVYYDFTQILSGDDVESMDAEDMQFLTAKQKLEEHFDVATTHMILCGSDLPAKDAQAMARRIEKLDGVTTVLSLDSLLGTDIPADFLPGSVTKMLKSGQWQLMLINSAYAVSTDEVNGQIDAINGILKEYDPHGMLIGEAPCTKDLIEITDKDFTVVSWVSIGFVFLIILLTLRSATLPVILVAVIEFAVFINLGIPYYTHFTMPFIAPICISTIQLGSTVDYAILTTTRYKELRHTCDKRQAITEALAYAMPSVLVSALSFFAATFGVGLYSDIDLISSMCNLLARGAIVSMFSVLLVLPALLMLLDGVIGKTTLGMKKQLQSI